MRGPEYNRPPLLEAGDGNDAIFGARLDDETYLWRLPLVAGIPNGDPQRLTLGATVGMQPSVSLAGKVVFSTAISNAKRARNALYLADAATPGVSELLSIPNLRRWSEISRDGNWIVYHASGEEGYDAWEQKIPARTLLYSNFSEPVHVMRRDTSVRRCIQLHQLGSWQLVARIGLQRIHLPVRAANARAARWP